MTSFTPAHDMPAVSDRPARTVLLVEDNRGDADLIVELLAPPAAGPFRVVHVTSLIDAVSALRAMHVDAVLLDLRLPDGTGVDCINAVRSQAYDVPIVVLTGLDDNAIALSCLAAGAQDYIVKGDLGGQSLWRGIESAIDGMTAVSERRRADSSPQSRTASSATSNDLIVIDDATGLATNWSGATQSPLDRSPTEAIGEAARRDRPGASRVDDLRNAAGEIVGFTHTCTDDTQKIGIERDLRRQRRDVKVRGQMRALAARLNAIREDERTRIARDIHDELGQLLTGLKMDLRWLARAVAPSSDMAVERVAERIAEAERLADLAIVTVQRIAIELRPSVLDALGLSAAIRDEVRRFGPRAGISTHVNACDRPPSNPRLATALFRILQELLTNVARHARASCVVIDLTDDGESWILRVEDDGIGVPASADHDPASLGLMGIRERADTFGGTLALGAAPRGGTIATVRVPKGSAGRS